MNRRELVQTGLVNFPMNSSEYLHTGEGGMFVKLYVIAGDDTSYQHCFGTTVQEEFNECVIGSDLSIDSQREAYRKYSDYLDNYDYDSNLGQDCGSDLDEIKLSGISIFATTLYKSKPLYASILLGSTGWSGWSEEKKSYFIATVYDLTPEGLMIYNQMKSAFPNASVALVTFLET